MFAVSAIGIAHMPSHLDANRLQTLPSTLFQNNVLLKQVLVASALERPLNEMNYRYLGGNMLTMLPADLFINNTKLAMLCVHCNTQLHSA